MPDQFKRFLQEHNIDLNQKDVPRDIFNQIMQKSMPDGEIPSINSSTLSERTRYFYIGIAASLIFCMVAASILFFRSDIAPESNVVLQPYVQKPTSENSTPSKPFLTKYSNNTISINSSTIKNTIRENKKNPKSLQISSHLDLDELPLFVQSIIPSMQREASKPEMSMNINPSSLLNNSSIESKDALGSINIIPLESKRLIPFNADSTSIQEVNLTTDIAYSSSISKDQALNHKIKKSIFSFLAKKSRKWSNNTLSIDPIEKDSSTTIAINFKNNNFEFSKSLTISSSH